MTVFGQLIISYTVPGSCLLFPSKNILFNACKYIRVDQTVTTEIISKLK